MEMTSPSAIDVMPDQPGQQTRTDPADQSSGFQIALSLEAILYLTLIAFALIMRLPDLDVIPLNAHEANEALAVLQALEPRTASGLPQAYASQQPLMFTTNALTMTIGGAQTSAARLATALLGVGLVALPLLFRRWLGAVNALVMAALVAISPALLISSRSMGGAVWSMALALFTAWSAGRFAESRRESYALAASVGALMLAVAAEPAGFLTLISLIVGAAFAFSTVDDPDRHWRRVAFETLRQWPWLGALRVVALVLIVVGTVFLIYPQGLSKVGEALGAGLRGFTERPAGYPAAFPLLLSLVYEPVFWLFGLVGAYFVLTSETDRARQLIGRALVGWLVASVGWSLLYPGAQPHHALWLTAPLIGLSAFALERAITPVRDPFWSVPVWGPWLHGVVFVGILFIAGINLLWVGRTIMGFPPSLTPPLAQQEMMKLFMVLLALVLAVITFFLVGSIWGARGAWHGLGIGLFLFAGLYSFNTGWQAAITKVDDPREPWNVYPITRNLSLVRSTLRTASLRATGKPEMAEIVVQLAPDMVSANSIAWMLRDFPNVRYVNELSQAVSAPIVISPAREEPPQLGASYVGQDFATYFDWDRGTMMYWDLLPWLYDRQSRVPPEAKGRMILWVRSDVYGVDQGGSLPQLPQ